MSATKVKKSGSQGRKILDRIEQEKKAKGGVMSKYQQAKEQWGYIESNFTPKQKSFFDREYKKSLVHLEELSDRQIADYINGELDMNLQPTDITIPFFKLGYKFVVFNDVQKDSEFWEGVEMKKGGEVKDLNAEIKKLEQELGENPYPTEDASLLPEGHQLIGTDGNMWEVQKDYKDENHWVKAQEVVASVEPVVETIVETTVVESKKLTEIQQGLLEKGFINEDLTLTNKGKRIVEMHKFCFPLEVHPFSHIYYGLDRLYPNNKSVYLSIDRATMFTGESQEYFEVVENIPTSISDKSVYDADLEKRIADMKGEKIKFIPYSYCPAIDDEKTGVGFIVFGNMENTNELHINAGIYNYAMKVHEIDGWKADSEKAVFVYGYEGRKLKVVIRVQEQLIGLHDRIGMFDGDKVLEKLKSSYPQLFIKGEDIVKFETEKKQNEEEEIRQQRIQLIKSWEELIAMTDDKEEKEMYKKEIEKLNQQN